MYRIAAIFKIVLLLVNTFVLYSIYFFFLIFIKIFRRRYEPWRNQIMTWWGKGFAKILSMDLKVEGSIPEPPFFLVSNHLSYIDVPVYSSMLKTTYVSKMEVRHWPFIGFMAKTLGIIFVDRRKKRDVSRVNREISEQLNEYQGVVLFPEGMTSPGKEILPFRPPLLEHAASENIEVSYSALRYRTLKGGLPAYKSVCWWGNVPLHKHLFLLASNKRIIVTIRFGNDRLRNPDRKKLAEELHQKVSRIFLPMTEAFNEEFVRPDF
jgi:lyso-ornithine lipid O-acyltransferase